MTKKINLKTRLVTGVVLATALITGGYSCLYRHHNATRDGLVLPEGQEIVTLGDRAKPEETEGQGRANNNESLGKIKEPFSAPDYLESCIFVPSVGLYFAEEVSYQNLTWGDVHKKIIPRGGTMPTPAETWALIKYLESDLSNPRFRKVYDDILKITPLDNRHGEWQNAIFSKGLEAMYIQKVTELDEVGELVFSPKTPLETCLIGARFANISSTNNDGLLTESSQEQRYMQGETIYFYPPENTGAIARFGAISDWAGLLCIGDAPGSDPSLGVRVVVRPNGMSPKK